MSWVRSSWSTVPWGEAVDDPTITSAKDVQSEALDEMGETITSSLSIGLDDRAMDQIDAQCEPDLSELQVPSA